MSRVIRNFGALDRLQNIIGETFDRRGHNVSLSHASQTLRAGAIAVGEGEVISALGTFIGTVGSGLTVAKFGLYDTDGTLLGSADVSASIGSPGWLIAPITPYRATKDKIMYLAQLYVGTTPPTTPGVSSSFSGFWLADALTSSPAVSMSIAAQADLPATLNLAAGGTGYGYMVAV